MEKPIEKPNGKKNIFYFVHLPVATLNEIYRWLVGRQYVSTSY